MTEPPKDYEDYWPPRPMSQMDRDRRTQIFMVWLAFIAGFLIGVAI